MGANHASYILVASSALDPNNSGLTARSAFLVREGTICATGTRQELAWSNRNLEIVEFPNSVAIPGLIDCHVHLSFDASDDPISAAQSMTQEEECQAILSRSQRMIQAGVTTVRDLGDARYCVAAVRDLINRKAVVGPRILTAGVPITSQRGHCWQLGGEVTNRLDARRVITQNASHEADLLKIMVTGGRLTADGPSPTTTQFSAALLQAIASEARPAGVPLAAHAHSTHGIALALQIGAATIEHCRWMAGGGLSVPEELVRQLLAKRVYVVPTANARWHDLRQLVGEALADGLIDSFTMLHRRGVRLVAGTDAGIPGIAAEHYLRHTSALSLFGLTPLEVIRAATGWAAAAVGLERHIGALRAGWRADILLVDGDPTESLDSLSVPRAVIKDGHFVSPPKCRPTARGEA